MPNITQTLPDTEQSVLRPAIIDIIQQVQEITKIGKDTRIFWPGDIAAMSTNAGSIDNQNSERFAIFGAQRINFIEVVEDYNENNVASTSVTRTDNPAVFWDKALGIYIAPVYVSTDVTINFKYRSPSKTEALRWRDDIRMRVSQMRDINLHTATYHFPMGKEALYLVQQVQKLREENAGYGQTFLEYMASHSTDRLTLIGDTTGKDAIFVIAEKQGRIQGQFGFDYVPEKPERNDDTGTWEVNFSYKFTFDKPIALNMRYPIMIHNQLLPQDLTDFEYQKGNLNKVNKTFSLTGNALNAFEAQTTMNAVYDQDVVLRMPSFDDFLIESVPHGTGAAFIALTSIGEDKRTLLDLNDLGDFMIDKDIMKFIKEVEWPYITKQYLSVFYLSLHRNQFQASNGSLECDQDLVVRADRDLDMRTCHRIRFGVATNFTLLKRQAIDRLRMYPKAMVKVLASINRLLATNPEMNKLGDQPEIFPWQITEIYRFLTGFGLDNGQGGWGPSRGMVRPQNMFAGIDPRTVENYRNNRIKMKTVEASAILAYRGEDAPVKV
jgi:hypothetical protein